MDSHWQDQLLALVTRYGDACAQVAAERESGRHVNPPADRSAAWRAILTHVAQARDEPTPAGTAAARR